MNYNITCEHHNKLYTRLSFRDSIHRSPFRLDQVQFDLRNSYSSWLWSNAVSIRDEANNVCEMCIRKLMTSRTLNTDRWLRWWGSIHCTHRPVIKVPSTVFVLVLMWVCFISCGAKCMRDGKSYWMTLRRVRLHRIHTRWHVTLVIYIAPSLVLSLFRTPSCM